MQAAGLREALHNVRVLHIAGTKGKGSTAAFAARTLRECGYSVGLYTSPHLCDVRERIRLDGCALQVHCLLSKAQLSPELSASQARSLVIRAVSIVARHYSQSRTEVRVLAGAWWRGPRLRTRSGAATTPSRQWRPTRCLCPATFGARLQCSPS